MTQKMSDKPASEPSSELAEEATHSESKEALTRTVEVAEGYHVVPDFYGRSSGKMQDIRQLEPFASYARRVIKARRTMLYYDRLYTLFQVLKNLSATYENKGRKPRILEIGVYRGGGSYFLASVSNDLFPQRAEIYSVDTFTGHAKKDLKPEIDSGQKLMDFVRTDFESVKKYLSGYSLVTVLQGRIQEFGEFFTSMRFDLIHLDVDIYEPTYYSLRYFGKRMAKNGTIVVDDYGFHTCPGVKKAVDQYLLENPKSFTRFELLSGQCLLIKKS